MGGRQQLVVLCPSIVLPTTAGAIHVCRVWIIGAFRLAIAQLPSQRRAGVSQWHLVPT